MILEIFGYHKMSIWQMFESHSSLRSNNAINVIFDYDKKEVHI